MINYDLYHPIESKVISNKNRFALKKKLLDFADTRKQRRNPIPRIGGLSIFLGIFGWVESHKMGRLFRRAWGLATW